MTETVTIQEQRHTFWKSSAITSAVLCVILFLVFWNTDDPFWTGIFRLGAFTFFASAVLSYLKIMDGPLEVTLNSTDDLLLVSYKKQGETIQEEEFKRHTIKQITPTDNGKNRLISYLQPGSAAFEVNFTDTDRDLFLFQFGGRPLYFDEPSQQKVIDFLETEDIDI